MSETERSSLPQDESTKDTPITNPDSKRMFWATITLAVLLGSLVVYLMSNLLQETSTAIVYFGTATFLSLLIAAVVSIVFAFRHQELIGVKVLFFSLSFLILSVVSLFTGRAIPASFTYILISLILVTWILPLQLRRRYLVYASAILALTWIIESINFAWRIQSSAASIGPVVAILFGAILLSIAIRQTWHSMNLRNKFLLGMGISLVLVAITTISYAAVSLRNAAISDATTNAESLAKTHAATIKAEIELALDASRTLAQSLEAVKDPDAPIKLTRDQVNGMLKKLLIENPNFLGTYTLWEPNAFDGLDAENVNTVAHDETGRFIPYWIRDENGNAVVEALVDYETPGIGDWYLLPRNTKQEQILDPFLYPILGEDILLASLVTPIVVDGQFYGIVGVDMRANTLQKFTDDELIYGGAGRVVLISNNGTLAGATGRADLIGQPVTELSDLYADDLDNIQRGEIFTRQYGDDLSVFVPIQLGHTETPWSVNILIPNEQITARATTSMRQMALIGSLVTLLALIALWFIVRQLINPILDVTNTALQVAEGNLDARVTVTTQDELGVLATTFNSMTSQLQETLQGLEERVAARTKDQQVVAEIATKIASIQNLNEMLSQMVHLTQRRFGLYHAHVFTFREEDEGEELRIIACGYQEGDEHEGTHGTTTINFNYENSIVARCARERQAIIVNDVRSSPDWLPNPQLPETRAEMAIPMIVGNRLMGVLDVQSENMDAFSPEDANIQSTLATQIAVAMQNLLQYETSQKIATDLSVVAEVGIATATITNQDDLLQRVVDLSKESFGLYHAHIYLLNDAGDTLKLASGAGEVGRTMVTQGLSIPLDREQSLVARAARTQQGVVVNDVTQDANFLPNPLLPNTRAEMAVPMIVAGKVIGVLDVQAEQTGRFTEIDVNIKTTLASQIAVALENARSFQNTQKQAERESKVNLITQKIQQADTIEAAMQIAARELGTALGKRKTLISLNSDALQMDQE